MGKWEHCDGYAVSSPPQEVRLSFPLPVTPYLFWGLSPLYPMGHMWAVRCAGPRADPLLRDTLTSRFSCFPSNPSTPSRRTLLLWEHEKVLNSHIISPNYCLWHRMKNFSLKGQIVNVSALWVMASWFCDHGMKAATENTDWIEFDFEHFPPRERSSLILIKNSIQWHTVLDFLSVKLTNSRCPWAKE